MAKEHGQPPPIWVVLGHTVYGYTLIVIQKIGSVMNIQNHPKNVAFTPSEYEIYIEGRLGLQTAAWFEDMTLTVNEETSPPQTIIRGIIVDQAALYGLISRARDLGLTLLAVRRLDDAEEVGPEALGGDAFENIENGQSDEDS